ncbi:MAG: hypothetical protein ACFB0B_15835 [Thermonemataceae bacterium]
MNKKSKFQNILQGAIENKAKLEDNIKDNITVLEELKLLIPPLTKEEHSQLEQNILEEGCREALILWKDGERYVLIDGHNRYGICTKNKVDFKIEIKDFKDLGEVKDWMINNQLGKRNVTEKTKSYLRGTQYTLEKKKGKFKGNQYTGGGQSDHKLKTHERLAKMFKVSPKTIQRDEKFALAVDKISDNDADIKNKILNKEINLSAKFITEYATKGTSEQLLLLRKAIQEGKNIDEESLKIPAEEVQKLQKKATITPVDQLKKQITRDIKKIEVIEDIDDILVHLNELKKIMKINSSK